MRIVAVNVVLLFNGEDFEKLKKIHKKTNVCVLKLTPKNLKNVLFIDPFHSRISHH